MKKRNYINRSIVLLSVIFVFISCVGCRKSNKNLIAENETAAFEISIKESGICENGKYVVLSTSEVIIFPEDKLINISADKQIYEDENYVFTLSSDGNSQVTIKENASVKRNDCQHWEYTEQQTEKVFYIKGD